MTPLYLDYAAIIFVDLWVAKVMGEYLIFEGVFANSVF